MRNDPNSLTPLEIMTRSERFSIEEMLRVAFIPGHVSRCFGKAHYDSQSSPQALRNSSYGPLVGLFEIARLIVYDRIAGDMYQTLF